MSKFYFIVSIIGSYILLYSLYERIYAGEFIIKTKHKRFSIFYTMLLILWIFLVGGFSTLDYKRGKSFDSNQVLQGVFWIQLCLGNILTKRSLGITEGGVYTGNSDYSQFTKWTRIKSYTWISENKIQLKTWGRIDKIKIKELEVEEEQREEVDKLLNEFMNKKDSEINKKGAFRAIAYVILMGIVMSIGYVNLIRIGKPYMVHEIKLSEDEAVAILKKTWKPLEDLNKEDIKSKKDFDKVFEETMSKSMIDNLYEILVDKNKSKDGEIKFKEKVRIPNIYNKEMSVKEAYIESRKYKEENKLVNVEELIIRESGTFEEYSRYFERKNTFIKDAKGDWILKDISGLQSFQSP